MLPKHELHLKLSKDKKTFTGSLSDWDVTVVSRIRRVWIAKIKFLLPTQSDYTEYQTQETYESKLALDALLKAEGLPTQIGILDDTQTHLALLDIYAISVTWDTPPLSSARRLSMQDILKVPPLSPAKSKSESVPVQKARHTPPLSARKLPKYTPASRPPITLSPPSEDRLRTSAYPLWDTTLPSGIPKGGWYEE
jgi:hypothetical protein